MNTIHVLLLIITALQVTNLIILTKPYWEQKPDEMGDDELYADALKTAQKLGRVSTSLLQRKLGIGYARACRLMDRLEENNIIGPAEGAQPRKIINTFSSKK